MSSPDEKSEASSAPAPQVDKSHPRSSSFEKRHEAFRPPSMFARLKQAASSLITPEEKSSKEASQEQQPKSAEPAPKPEPLQDRGSDRASGDTSLDVVLDSDDPILFDLPSPTAFETVPVQKVCFFLIYQTKLGSKLW